ncbi:MAG: hypothetical protein CMJ76_09420 [Planctomycetaceae bacterium]|nr:hypothetical protein [Planctomycetaceae bacterium]
MLTITDVRSTKTCDGYSRRDFIRIGGAGLGSLTLPSLLAANEQPGFVKDRAVVLLFLQGGPSHIEFFDPKMTAPPEIRSITGEIQTRTPGITFGSTFPQLAGMTDKFTILRSYQSRNSGHTYQDVVSAKNPFKATMSSIYSRISGTNNPVTGLPSNVLLKPEAIRPELKLGSNFETNALPGLTSPGSLGQNYMAFDPAGGSELKDNLELKIPASRFTDRRSLLSRLDHIRRFADTSGLLEGASKFQQQAFDVIAQGVADAFDLGQESPETLTAYDTTGYFNMRDLNRHGDLRRTSNLLGHQMLLARRLVERGCGFVTVSDCGWDHHANGNSPKNMTAFPAMSRQVDHAVAAFIQDLFNRGLEDKVLLIVTGEMGRTPRINKNGGRDHWGNLTSLLMAGAGIKPGQVIGQSDRQAGEPLGTAYEPKHLLGTVLRTFFDIGELRLQSQFPADLIRLAEETPVIDPLIS